MRAISLRAWLLVILSAGLQVFMFPTGGPIPVWRAWLCWVALAPFFWALSLPDKNGSALSLRDSVLLGYLCGFLWYFGNCFWIYQTMYLYGGLPKAVSFAIVILFSLYLGLYHALFAGLFAVVRASRSGVTGALVATPFLWVAVELARGRITGFPWDLSGYVEINNLLVIQIAPFAGVMGISFLIAAINAGLSSLVLGRRRAWKFAACSALLAVSLEAAAGWEGTRLVSSTKLNQYAVMMQENLSVGAMGRGEQRLSEEEELELFSQASLHPRWLPEVKGKLDEKAAQEEVILWPEAPSRLQSDDPLVRERLGKLARTAGARVIAGSLGVDQDSSARRGYYLYDSASLIGLDGSYAGRYDKIHLVPWGEYVPFQELFSFAEKLTEGVGDMDRGKNRTIFPADRNSYGVFICYESIFGDEVREFVRNGADVLVNLSDDGWYGETGAPWQHLNMARMRAVENHRWVLRATNTGVTTAIDPEGRMAAEAPRHVRAAFAFPFQFEKDVTFYTRHGNWFAYLCAIVSVIGVGAGWVRGLRPRGPVGRI